MIDSHMHVFLFFFFCYRKCCYYAKRDSLSKTPCRARLLHFPWSSQVFSAKRKKKKVSSTMFCLKFAQC